MRTCPTAVLEVILELIPLHMVIKQTAKQTLLQMTAEGVGKGKVISSQQMKALSEEMPLGLLPKEQHYQSFTVPTTVGST